MSQAEAKLPYDRAAITHWCAGRGLAVSVERQIGDGALNVHWLLTEIGTGRTLVFRHRGQGHWLSHGYGGEARAQTMARQAGVCAPEVLYADSFGLLMAFVEGTAERETVLSVAAQSSVFRNAIVSQLKMLRSTTAFVFEGDDRVSWLAMVIERYCLAHTRWFSTLADPDRARGLMQRVGELGFETLCLSHGDFRTGNLLCSGEQLTGVLDWEFAAYRPLEADVGWMLSSPWRYSRPDLAASGLMGRQDLLRALDAADTARLRGWEALALLRWVVIAALQDERQGVDRGTNADEQGLLAEAESLLRR